MAGDMIRVECECGKAARVPARYAGRMVKCSGCGGKLTIPEESAPQPGYSAGGDVEASDAEASDAEASDAEAPASGGAIGSPVGGRVGSRIGSPGRRPSSGQAPRRPSSGQREGRRPSSGERSRERGRERDRGGTPDYGLPSKQRRSSSSSANDPYAPPTADVDETTYRRRGRGSGEQARDLSAEAHIVAIGIWQRISGVLLIAAVGIMGVGMLVGAAAGPGGVQPGPLLVAILMAAVLLGLAVLYYQVGVALMNYAPWARVAMVVLYVLGILRVVVTFDICGAFSTVIYGGVQLWALYGQRGSRIFYPGYAQATRNDRRPVPWATSPFFWLPFVLFALFAGLMVFAVILGGLR